MEIAFTAKFLHLFSLVTVSDLLVKDNISLRKMDELEMKGHSYLKNLQIVISYSIKNGYSKAKDCPIKTKYSPTGYDINKRKGKQSKHIMKNRIKDLTEPEKQRVIDFYHTADIPATQKKHLAYWVLAYKLCGVNFKDVALMSRNRMAGRTG